MLLPCFLIAEPLGLCLESRATGGELQPLHCQGLGDRTDLLQACLASSWPTCQSASLSMRLEGVYVREQDGKYMASA